LALLFNFVFSLSAYIGSIFMSKRINICVRLVANVVRWRWLSPVSQQCRVLLSLRRYAEGFIDDSTLTGGIYYWQRERDRKDVTDHDKYKTNLSHSTGTLTSTSSPVMRPICLVLISQHLPLLK
jgi:hypothetical protein